jgi:quercetin dioxygenase-like cupin family protein
MNLANPNLWIYAVADENRGMVRRLDEEAVPSVYNRSDIPERRRGESVTLQRFRGLDVNVGFVTKDVDTEPGEPHAHPWEQINYVLKGSCTFSVNGEALVVTEGDIFLIPPGVDHAYVSSDECCTLLTVSPLREDYLKDVEYQDEFVSLEE